MTIRYLARAFLVLLAVTAFGCGGGGGGGTATPPANPTKATLTLSIPSLPAGTQVGGVIFTIQLPPGVSPAVLNGTDASGSATLTGGASSVNSLSIVDFTPSATSPQISFGTVTLNSFGAGDFMIVNCVIASGATVSTSGFSVLNPQVFDSVGALIPSATINISVALS